MTFGTLRPSLLYPAGAHKPTGHAHALNEHDLGLTSIVHALDFDRRHNAFISGVLHELNGDPATIRYRQDVLTDLLHLSALREQLEALLPALRELTERRPFITQGDVTPLLLVGGRLAELDNYVQCVESLFSMLDEAGDQVQAEGLRALHAYLVALRNDEEYVRLAAALPALREQLDHASSVTIGINLGTDLQPESATIIGINAKRFAGKGTLLDRLFGERVASEALRGVTALYKASEGRDQAPEHEFFRDLNRLLERVATPVAATLEQFKRLNTAGVAALEPEVAFYVGAAKLITRLRAQGLALCRPDVVPVHERVCHISDSYSLDLALRMEQAGDTHIAVTIVPNEVAFGSTQAFCIITGPNSGGKTTYTRAVGQAQVLFQAGLCVPGTAAQISPVDLVLTHFAAAERLDRDGGRLEEELERLAVIFAMATSNSLVLLNEPLTSTDHQAARLVARDIVAGLQMLGARTIFVTHLYELYDELVAQAHRRNNIISLVADNARQTEEARPTYKIERGIPHMHNHAHDLAEKYGLSRIQIEQTLRQRGMLPADSPGQVIK